MSKFLATLIPNNIKNKICLFKIIPNNTKNWNALCPPFRFFRNGQTASLRSTCHASIGSTNGIFGWTQTRRHSGQWVINIYYKEASRVINIYYKEASRWSLTTNTVHDLIDRNAAVCGVMVNYGLILLLLFLGFTSNSDSFSTSQTTFEVLFVCAVWK